MKKVLIIIGIFLVIIICLGCYIYSKDNYRFKIDYELYNRVEYNNGKKIKVKIPTDNKVEYINAKELAYVLEKGTAVIYFGYTSCPWCRNAIPILIDSIKDNDIDTLYYVDIHNVSFGKYKDKIMKILDPYLKENEDGEKVIAVPDVYVVKEGKIIGHHRGTVESFKNPYNGMNSKQKKELKKIYDDMIGEIK